MDSVCKTYFIREGVKMKKVWLVGRFVGFVEKPPRGYGLAYVPYNALGGIYFPYPLNKTVGKWRDWWIQHKDRRLQDYEEKAIDSLADRSQKIYDDGYKNGYEHGCIAGRRALGKEIHSFYLEEK